MRDAPLIVDHLCADCSEHFALLQSLLRESGVRAKLNPRIVRGLDYYCRTAFEITAAGLGSQNAIGGGGRYDGLVAALGGPKVAGIGFAIGVERLMMVAEGLPVDEPRPVAFLALLEAEAIPIGMALARRLREVGAHVEVAQPGRSLKALMRQADRSKARYVLILGSDEIAAGRGTVRDMERKTDRSQSVDLEADGLSLLAQIEGSAAVTKR